jgi:hypothetical protein
MPDLRDELVLAEIFGSEISTKVMGEPSRVDLYSSVREYGHGLWVASFNYAQTSRLLDQLARIRWRFADKVILLVSDEEIYGWTFYRLDVSTRSWRAESRPSAIADDPEV